jgi:large subunit ribosomal protein L4
MEVEVRTLAGDKAGTVTLPESTFGLEPRADILQRVVRWQLARRQTGTHKVKSRGEIDATGKKMYRQKGTGRARHSDKKATQFRGGAKPHGPKVRSHAHDLPKKVRALGLRHALSAKARGEALIVLDAAAVDEAKTKALRAKFAALGLDNALIIDGEVDESFAKAARNIPAVDVLPLAGINVYDIMRRRKLVLTRAALDGLEARFAGAAPGSASSAGASEADASASPAPTAAADAAVEGAAANGASEADAAAVPGETGAEGERE